MARNTVIVSVLADTKQFTKGFKEADSALGKIGSIGKVAAKAVAGVGAALVGLAAVGGFARALRLDEARTQLAALGYTADQVTGIMDSALSSVEGTAFGLDQAATIAAQALASGVPEGQRLTDALTTVANTAALAKVGMDEMGSIFSKVWANGKVTTQEMNQLADRGVPIWQYLSEAFNVSTSELRKMIEAGEVSADMFENALAPAVDGMATAMGSSFKGMAANAAASLSRVGALFAGPLLESAKGFLGEFTILMDGLGERLAPVAARFADFLGSFSTSGSADAILGFFDQLLGAAPGLLEIASYFSPIGIALQVLEPLLPPLAGAFGQLASTIGGALSGLLPVLASLFQQVSAALIPVLAPVLQLATTLADALAPVIEALVPIITLLVDLIVRLLPAITPIISAIVQLVAPIVALIAPLLQLVQTLLPPLIALFEALVGIIVPVVQALVNALLPVIEAIVDALGGLIDFIVGVFTGDWEKAWNGIRRFVEGIWNAILGLWTAVWSAIFAFAKGIFDNIVRTVQTWGRNLYNGITTAWNLITDFFSDVPGNIRRFFDGVALWLWNAGQDLIRGLGNGIRNMGQWVLDQIGSVINGAIDWAKGLLGINSPSRVFAGIGRNLGQGLANGITGETRNVVRAVGGLSDAVTNGFDATLDPGHVALRGAAGGTFGTGGAVYNITVQALAPSPEIGRNVVEAIRDYEHAGGRL